MSGVPPAHAGRPARPAPFFSRQQLWLIGATGMLVLAGLGVVVAYVKAHRPAAQSRPDPEMHATLTQVPQAELLPDAAIESPDTADLPIDKDAAAGLRTALGAFTFIGIRQASWNIGLLADGVQGEIYTVAAATKELDLMSDLLADMDEQLENLPAAVFDAADRGHIAKARGAIRLLQTQAKALRAYWQDQDKESAARFQKARVEAQEAIQKLFPPEP